MLGKQIFSLGSFSEVGQKQKTEKKNPWTQLFIEIFVYFTNLSNITLIIYIFKFLKQTAERTSNLKSFPSILLTLQNVWQLHERVPDRQPGHLLPGPGGRWVVVDPLHSLQELIKENVEAQIRIKQTRRRRTQMTKRMTILLNIRRRIQLMATQLMTSRMTQLMMTIPRIIWRIPFHLQSQLVCIVYIIVFIYLWWLEWQSAVSTIERRHQKCVWIELFSAHFLVLKHL